MTYMIAVELRGGLGNQMFQYAFALAASHRLNTDFVVYASTAAPEGEQLSQNFTLGACRPPVNGDPGYPMRWIDNQDYDRPEDILSSLSDGAGYSGYFQSSRFFAEVEHEVRERLGYAQRSTRRFADASLTSSRGRTCAAPFAGRPTTAPFSAGVTYRWSTTARVLRWSPQPPERR